jgi:hypothetical protein
VGVAENVSGVRIWVDTRYQDATSLCNFAPVTLPPNASPNLHSVAPPGALCLYLLLSVSLCLYLLILCLYQPLSVSASVCICLCLYLPLSVSASVCISCLLPLSLFPGHQECLCLSSSTCTRTSTQHPLPPQTALLPLHIHSLPKLALVPKLPSYPLQPPSNERADFS